MAETKVIKNKKTGEIVVLRRKTKPEGKGLSQMVEAGRARVDAALPNRMDNINRGIQNMQRPGVLSKGIGVAQAAMGVPQRLEASVANPLMAYQDWARNIGEKGFFKGTQQTGFDVARGYKEAFTGEKSGQLGDVMQRGGASPGVAATIGLMGVLPVGIKAGQKANVVPTAHTDKLITGAGKSIVSKVKSKLASLRTAYDDTMSPYLDRPVSPDTFGTLLKQAPKKIRRELQQYSNILLDAKGQSTSTVGKLYKMYLKIEDMVKDSKEPLSRLGQYSRDLTDLAKTTKATYIRQLPKAAQATISKLDKVFGPVISKGNAIVKKVADKGDRIKTEWLTGIFKNPTSGGSREFLREMSQYGINLTDDLKVYASFAKRQGQKKLAGTLARRVAPWVIGGELLGRHMGGE